LARILAVLTIAVTGIASVYGASLGINPGDTLNPDGTVSIGLLPNNPANTASGATTVASANADGITTSGSTNANGNFAQRNFFTSTTFLSGSTVTPGLPQTGSPVCNVNCQETIYAPAGKPTFDLLGDGTNNNKNSDIWYSLANTSTQTASINIPIGIMGVSSVATMLNSILASTTGGSVCITNGGVSSSAPALTCGANGGTASYAYLTLNLNTKLDGTGTAAQEVFALINGVTQRNVFSGAAGAQALAPGGFYNVTDPFNSQSYAVQVGNEWNGAVSGTTNNGTTMSLDYQIFPIFSEYSGYYLNSISITDTGSTAGNREVLSAITVNATPEPSTVIMLLTGIGAVGIARVRRKKS